MATLRRLNRPTRKLPTAEGLDAITRAAQQGSAIQYDPRAMTVTSPQIDVRGFLDEARGTAAIGQGVASLGTATLKLAEEQGRAVAFTQKLDAEAELGAIETELATAIMSQPDELQWGGILEQHLEKARSQVLSKPRLGIAQEEVMAAHSRWEKQQRHNVTMQQARRSFDRVREGISAKATKLRSNKDFAGLAAMAEDPEVAKWIGEDNAASIGAQAKADYEAEVEKTKFEGNLAIINKDPWGWEEANKEPWEDDSVMWTRLKNAADARKGEITTDSVDRTINSIVSGDIKVPEQIKNLKDPGLTPRIKEQLMADIGKYNQLASDQEKAANGEKNWLNLWKKVRAWEGGPSDKAALEYYEMSRDIRYGVPDDQQGKLMEILYRKMGSTKTVEIPGEVQKTATRIINDMFNRGAFNDGKPMKIEDENGNTIDAPGAIVRSAAIEGQLYIDLQRYLAAKPDEADPLKIPAVINRLLPEVVRKNLATKQDEIYAPKPANAKAEAAEREAQFKQMVDDIGLPISRESGDQIDTMLFPTPKDQPPPFTPE